MALTELMLIENPGNPTFVAPYRYTRQGNRVVVPGYIRTRNIRRNTMAVSAKSIGREWFGGMNLTDMGSALGGLAASTMLPPLVVKDTSTTGMKVAKAVTAFACAAGAGFIFRNINPLAGRYAVAGGVAGALAVTLGLFTGVQIGAPGVSRSLPVGRSRVGASYMEPSMPYEAGVQVSVT